MMAKKLCLRCGLQSKGTVRGSLLVTLFLLCFGILPGILYECWRTAGGRNQCRHCGNSGMVPSDSPIAKRILKENET